MKPLLRRIPGILLLIFNWAVVAQFSLHVPLMDFLILFILTSVEYAIIWSFHKLRTELGGKGSIDGMTGEIILQTTFFCFLLTILLLLPQGWATNSIVKSSVLFGVAGVVYYALAELYNTLLKTYPHFKNLVDLIFLIWAVLLPIVIIGSSIIDMFLPETSFRIVFLFGLPLVIIKGVPYAYEFFGKERADLLKR